VILTSSQYPEDAQLAHGLTRELSSLLGLLGNLPVSSAASVQALEDQGMSASEIGRKLGVSHLLEGDVRKIGSHLRLEVRLVDVRNNSIRRAETFDRALGETFSVLDDIARLVARALDVQWAGGDRHLAALRYRPNGEAVEWYLRGMDLSVVASNGRRQEGIEYFKRAIEADSNFAAAYAGLAHRYVRDGSRIPAEQAALKALALDDSLGHAHSALGWVRMVQRQWDVAVDELQRAIALDPNAQRAFEGLARVHMMKGQAAEQLVAATAGWVIDSVSVSAIRELALALSTNGRCDEALQRLLPLKELHRPPGVAGVIRGQCYAAKQMWPEAIEEFRWSSERSDAEVALGFLGYALARAGERADALIILDDLLAGREDSLGPFGIFSVYAGLGDYDQAFVWLEKAVDENKMRPYIMGPMFEELRLDPRFAGIKKKLGV
jgi:TolB-like protein